LLQFLAQVIVPGGGVTLQCGANALGHLVLQEVLHLRAALVQDAVDAEVEVGLVQLEQFAQCGLQALVGLGVGGGQGGHAV
jgi:hypothetical protein